MDFGYVGQKETHPKNIDKQKHNGSVSHVEACTEANQEDQIDTQVIPICMDQRVAEVPPCLVLFLPF